ncbi:tripartite tricarboxylate transporter substrate binding protein [Achromobacter sp. GG226]|uniref:Bug family tripartite tricarboxylate transporter substrate binding protein n=1 Tax=Verticiella alkaliphila TaxID=2779529 RepID=UPI001C0C72E6|nr:tripartite tricarboxylate transporter substrate binding protein [Verticiella sp. GG226]MBU4610429.1 tripartite tricarboxylate transporter substrate binding protein [Verticiella sp. GG226]
MSARLVRLLPLVLATLSMSAAHAAWPERPVRIVVPSAAGGSPDIVTRLLSKPLSERLGQPVVIENRPGAAGNIGMQTVMTAAPDGYTLGFGNNATLATNEFLFSQLPYDPAALTPVIYLARTASLLVVNPQLPVHSIAELIDYGKAQPHGFSYGSGGTGTSGHLGAELFRTLVDVPGMHVPYKGAPQAISDLMGARFDFMLDNLASVGPSVSGGKLRALAITSRERSPRFPDVPTLHESGLTDFDMQAWAAIVAPPGTPEPVVQRLNAELNAILKDPAVQAQLGQLAFVPAGGSPADLTAWMQAERVKWGEVVRTSGAKVD